MEFRAEDLEELLSADDANEDQQMIVELIGAENYLKIIEYYGGSHIYIPNYFYLSKKHRNIKLIKDYNGTNIKELAKKYKITTSQIYNILTDYKKGNKQKKAMNSENKSQLQLQKEYGDMIDTMNELVERKRKNGHI